MDAMAHPPQTAMDVQMHQVQENLVPSVKVADVLTSTNSNKDNNSKSSTKHSNVSSTKMALQKRVCQSASALLVTSPD
jgi:hypothetical protein